MLWNPPSLYNLAHLVPRQISLWCCLVLCKPDRRAIDFQKEFVPSVRRLRLPTTAFKAATNRESIAEPIAISRSTLMNEDASTTFLPTRETDHRMIITDSSVAHPKVLGRARCRDRRAGMGMGGVQRGLGSRERGFWLG